ncbi:hypothetical protein BH09GEM1_BH09GEM1_04390 [soil metagenome]
MPGAQGSENETCRVCGNHSQPLFRGRVLDLEVQYYECPNCAYVQTERPYWLDRAYNEVINDSDTGIITRNTKNTRITLAALGILGSLDERVVDFAGGYGLLVRMLRDYGVDAFWHDPFCENLVARGFEHRDGSAGLVTAFEAFEHFVEPVAELRQMLNVAPYVLISTVMVPTPTPSHEDWWYYGREHGQHVGMFRLQTLKVLAAQMGKSLVSDGYQHHLFADREINPTRWKLALRFNRMVPALLGKRLASRTWTDHLLMSRARSARS